MIVGYDLAARAEVIEALRWYADVAGGSIAYAFERELDAAVKLLMRFLRLGSPGPNATRKLRLNRFPCTLHDRLDAESIWILTVANQRRRSAYWRYR